MLFRSLGDKNGYHEFNSGGPSLILTVDLNECRCQADRLAAAMNALYEHMNAGMWIKTKRAPYISNRGTADCPDPHRAYPDEYVCPVEVRQALRPPRRKE